MKTTNLEKGMNALSLIIISAIITYTVRNYHQLPENMPIHFGLNGEIGNYISSKYGIFVYLGIGLIVAVGSIILSKYPNVAIEKLKLTKVEITDGNRKRQYMLAKIFIQVLGLEMLMMSAYMQYGVTKASIEGYGTVGASYLIGMAIMLLTILAYKIRSRQLK